MLDLKQAQKILSNNISYFHNRYNISLFELKNPDTDITAPLLTRLDSSIFTVKNIPATDSLSDKVIRGISQDMIHAYGIDIYSKALDLFPNLMGDIILKNPTLRKWVKQHYDKGKNIGIYIISFVDPYKTPVDIKAFVLRSFLAIQARTGEPNLSNIEMVKKALGVRK